MAYYVNSYKDQMITDNPRITTVPLIHEFIRDTCRFCLGANMPTEEIYDKYVKYCNDKSTNPGSFNGFARSFKYYALHQNMMHGIGYCKVNYFRDHPIRGLIKKTGWAYINLTVNY